MTIDLPQFRAYVESIRRGDDAEVSPPVLLALIDTAEAAKAYRDATAHVTIDQPGSYEWSHLDAALTKFTWTQP